MSNNNEWHKRHAIQIVAQLPENAEDALLVLALAKILVEQFLAPEVISVADLAVKLALPLQG